MADKEISMLPATTGVTDDTIIPVYQPGALDPAQKMTGAQFRAWAEECVRIFAELAEQHALTAEQHAASIDPDALNTLIALKGDNLEFDSANERLYLTSNGVRISNGIKIVTSGGGSGPGSPTNEAAMTASNTSGFIYKTISAGSPCSVSFNWSSVESGMQTGPGSVVITVNGALKYAATIAQGDISIDMAPYLGVGSSAIVVSIADVYGNTRTLAFNINVVSLNISADFDDVTPKTGAFEFRYTPVGATVKTVYFYITNINTGVRSLIGTQTVTTSNREVPYTIPAQSHGGHVLEVYFTAVVAGETVSSKVLQYAIICTEKGNTSPVFSTTFTEKTVKQYDTVVIPYKVHVPDSLTADIVWTVGDDSRPITVDSTPDPFTWIPVETGLFTLSVSCGGKIIWALPVSVEESEIDAEAETNSLELHLTSYGRSNGEADPSIWTDGNVAASLTGFNFVADGWQQDEDGITVLRVSGDARVTIPVKPFATGFRNTGKTIEIEFATRDVRDYDAVICSCWSGGRGIQITTQQALFASEQSSVFTKYKENEHVRLSFSIQKDTEQRLIQIYINGILSGVERYPDGDDFAQLDPVDITLGNNDATIDVYNVRIYGNGLSRFQVLDNWIADTQLGTEKMDRWRRNRIYDEYGQIVIPQLPTDLPYLIITAGTLPQFKGDKKTCSGRYVDPIHPERSFTFEGAEIDVQGTSSQYYYVKNYKIKFKGGFTVDGTRRSNYQMNDNAVPTDTFTFKADVASSEGANNVVLAQLYNELCPVKTPPQLEDPKVRQTIDGHPIVVFWDDGSENLQFLGKYNFNNDKGTEEVFGFAPGDESWEILQNGTERVGFKSADFSGTDWKNDFEGRYPDKNSDPSTLAEFAAWVASTYQDAATGEALPSGVDYGGVTYTHDTAAYRLAKFRAELPDWAHVDALVFYYVFTELVLAIDQREKNAFPTIFQKDGKWLVFFYDADSTLGIDNKGKLAFDYYLEDIDYTAAGEPIFNGQNSVLWVNLRQAFADEIKAEYRRLRTQERNDGTKNNLLSYDVMDAAFDAHQSKWPEAIFNEDGWRKSIEPLIQAGDTLYLPMLQGKKELQRKWWLYNRFRYLDSKYQIGTSESTKASIRTRTKGSVWLTSFVNMYGHVSYNNETVTHRMERGVACEFEWNATGAEDPVVGISNMDMITSLGDLSPILPERVDISLAERLEELKVGDASDDYENASLTDVTFGNNRLLRKVDLRNCSAYTNTPDLRNCANIEEVYLDGTAVPGVNLPNGGYLKKLHLPATVTNLTIRNQPYLSELVLPLTYDEDGYCQITTLNLENAPDIVPARAILNAMKPNTIVRLVGFVWGFDNAEDILSMYDKLDKMRGIDANDIELAKPQLSGTVWVPDLTEQQLAEMQERYPTITVRYDAFRKYIVRFYNGDKLLQTVSDINYGTKQVKFAGSTATLQMPGVDDPENYVFAAWYPAPVNIHSDLNCMAVFRDKRNVALSILHRTISGEYTNSRVTTIRPAAFSRCTGLTAVSFPNVTTVGQAAFDRCESLTSVSIPKATELGPYAMSSSAVEYFESTNVTQIAEGTFSNTKSAKEIRIPNCGAWNTGGNWFSDSSVELIEMKECTGYMGFKNCINLKALIIRCDNVYTPYWDNMFTGSAIEDGTGYIYVPGIFVDSFKTNSYWSKYSSQIRAIEDYPEITGG